MPGEGERRGLDRARIAIAGDSAGANLALATGLLARARAGGPRYALVWEQYAPEVTARAPVTCSPLRASRAQLAGSSATLLLKAEHDVLRDEGEAFAVKLTNTGVAVSAVRYQ